MALLPLNEIVSRHPRPMMPASRNTINEARPDLLTMLLTAMTPVKDVIRFRMPYVSAYSQLMLPAIAKVSVAAVLLNRTIRFDVADVTTGCTLKEDSRGPMTMPPEASISNQWDIFEVHKRTLNYHVSLYAMGTASMLLKQRLSCAYGRVPVHYSRQDKEAEQVMQGQAGHHCPKTTRRGRSTYLQYLAARQWLLHPA